MSSNPAPTFRSIMKEVAEEAQQFFRGELAKARHEVAVLEAKIDAQKHSFVQERAAVRERLAALEQRDGTEQRAAPLNFADVHKGVWRPGHSKSGDVFTHNDGWWLCRADTDTRPGDSPDWQLILKGPRRRGSDSA